MRARTTVSGRSAVSGLAVVIALAAVTGLAGCSTPGPRDTPAPSPSSTNPNASEAPSPSDTVTPAPTTPAPEGWTAAELTAACAEFQAGWAEGEGYAADDFDWGSPAMTQHNGETWYVFLSGTFTTPEGDRVPAEYSCAVTGTRDAPVVKESPSQ